MIDPVIALVVGSIVTSIVTFIFFPEKGLISRYKRANKDQQRVIVEDALKHIFDCEHNNESCPKTGLALKLNISEDKAEEFIRLLETMDLIKIDGNSFELTKEGREYALRVIRTHRLLERYLADETSLHANDWHNEAERLEHEVTQDQIENLAAQLGNPVVDPHGDPIPTANGHLPKLDGVPLDQMETGQVGKILHIEDEPSTIYHQLNAIGLFKWMQVHVLEKTETKIKFYANDEVHILAPEFAHNVTVQVLENENDIIQEFKSLSKARMGKPVKIKNLSRGLRGKQRRRLMDLGLVPGTIVIPELKSKSGNPVAYKIRGASIAIRNDQADLIYIEDVEGDNNE